MKHMHKKVSSKNYKECTCLELMCLQWLGDMYWSYFESLGSLRWYYPLISNTPIFSLPLAPLLSPKVEFHFFIFVLSLTFTKRSYVLWVVIDPQTSKSRQVKKNIPLIRSHIVEMCRVTLQDTDFTILILIIKTWVKPNLLCGPSQAHCDVTYCAEI